MTRTTIASETIRVELVEISGDVEDNGYIVQIRAFGTELSVQSSTLGRDLAVLIGRWSAQRIGGGR